MNDPKSRSIKFNKVRYMFKNSSSSAHHNPQGTLCSTSVVLPTRVLSKSAPRTPYIENYVLENTLKLGRQGTRCSSSEITPPAPRMDILTKQKLNSVSSPHT
ncbi:hypothetical protein VTJ04DRAFT_1174 [Mycothermus thermophilus]|uniref:uncharacterized protein n=1 Tax=Humicola insolens TaxID=85995 RepID=UPI0037425FE0